MMKDAVFGGVNAAVLTPLRDDLSPDLDRMAEHCRWLLASGCNGLGILGTTGEANSLGIAQRVAIMEGLTERGVAPATLMPGTGTPALADTVFLTERARSLGCKGVLVLPPFFYKNPAEDGLFASYSELVNRIGGGMRVYLYHFPQQSAVPITLSLIARLLAAFPGVIKGAKDSSGDFANTSAMVREFGQDGFEVYGADDGRLQDLLKLGAAGGITAAGNVNSTVAAQVYADWNGPAGAAAQIVLAATQGRHVGPTYRGPQSAGGTAYGGRGLEQHPATQRPALTCRCQDVVHRFRRERDQCRDRQRVSDVMTQSQGVPVMRYVIEPPPQPAIPVLGEDAAFPVRRIWCVGRNYADHAREMGHDPSREPPFFFAKFADTVVPGGGELPFPSQTQDLHHEIEMVVAIGKGGSDIPPEQALSHVYGYAIGLDMTRRDIQAEAKKLSRPWELAKSFDQSCPISAIAPATRIGHPTRGRIEVAVNGSVQQTGDLAQMIWSVPETLSFLSRYVKLAPGDLIMTGTPAGVSRVQPGDVVRGLCEGIGEITVTYRP